MIDKNITLKELAKFVDISNVTNYKIKALTKHSTIERFDYKGHHMRMLRCNATAITLVRVNDFCAVLDIVRICDEHNICSQNSKAIRKFCLEIGYKTYSVNYNKICAPNWAYIKEDLLKYARFLPLNWAINYI